MSLKDLFADNKKNSAKPIIKKSLKDIEDEGADSNVNVEEFNYLKNEYEPFIDYTTASNFAKYGSAEEYFDSSIKRIYQEFPYDGSTYEVNKWLRYSNGVDKFIFENEYPRTTGHARFSPVSYGGVRRLANTYYSVPATKEYILFKGGPNKDNVWKEGKKQTSNLEINGTNGNTIEFWLKKDAFSESFPREVILDVWRSGSIEGVENEYGRLTIELDRQNQQLNKSPFLVTYKSGSSGFNQQTLGTSQLALSASDGNWHHYAISFKSNVADNETIAKLYVDGNINDSRAFAGTVSSINNSLIGTLGALAAAKSATSSDPDPSYVTNNNLGFGKLSASLDDFRYWKTERTSKQIGSNWFTNVRGGSNTKEGNNSLGVYYKFNEGIVGGDSRIDLNVLDYSGRATNGVWYGFRDTSRSLASAIVQSSASLTEFKDPILYIENPKLNSYILEKKELGRDHDINNSTCLYYSVPSWILEDENFEGNLKSLTQIIGSYFDTLCLQIGDLSKLNHIRYEDYVKKPNPFMRKILASRGLDVPELFVDSDILSLIANKSDEIVYEQKINDVKNLIYTNLYNNLNQIYKLKGTEAAFRNIMRCYGIDEKLLAIKIYSDNVHYQSFDQYIQETIKDKLINFSKESDQGGVIFQQSSSFNNDADVGIASYNYVSGTHDALSVALATTTEINVNFPAVLPYYSEHRIVRPLSSSLFGAYTDSDSSNVDGFKNSSKDHGHFEVFAVKEEDGSKNAKFVLTSRSELLPSLETPVIQNVYDDTNWNVSVKVSPEKFGPFVSGSSNAPYTVQLYAVSSIGDSINKRYEVSGTMSYSNGIKFQKHSKRFYVGAKRLNFTGSLLAKADSKISSFRHWLSGLDNKDLDSHSLERKSYGISDPFKVGSNLVGSGATHLRNIDSLAIHWEFDNVSGSDSNGQFIVDDISSGSAKQASLLSTIASSYHPARGFGFSLNSDSFLTQDFVATNRKIPMGELRSSDLIKIKTKKDEFFPESVRPSNHYFSIEKGLYDVISREMLNMFSSIKEYGALLGNPANRYRSNYKSLDKLRELFFTKVQNNPSVEKFLEFYKWLDKSVDGVLDQFIPATSNFSEDIRNVIESHAFERSKYKTQFPTLEGKISEPIASITGINELRYDWKSGHAPFAISRPFEKNTASITVAANKDKSDLQIHNDKIFIHDGSTGTLFTLQEAGSDSFYLAALNWGNYQEFPAARVKINVNFNSANSYQIANHLKNAINSEDSELDIEATTISPGSGDPTAAQTITLLHKHFGVKGISSNEAKGDVITITDFSGGQGLIKPQSVSCLWWNDRAERSEPLISTGDADVDAVRETLRQRINSVISGSAYSERRLTRPYKLSADFQVPIHGGDNFNLNKKKDFYIGTTRPLSTDFIQVSSSLIKNNEVCDDVKPPDAGGGVPRSLLYYEADERRLKTKVKLHFKADISNTNNDHSANHILPFNFYSSSLNVPSDYKQIISRRFGRNVDITNLHSDSYGDDREIPIQGPFTQHFVGGHHHRHVPLNRSGSFAIHGGRKQKIGKETPEGLKTGLDAEGDRREAFFIRMNDGELLVVNPDAHLTSSADGSSYRYFVPNPEASANSLNVLREPLAKRPVNIRNIQTTTGSLYQGNYQRDYEILQGSGLEISKGWLVENHNNIYKVDEMRNPDNNATATITTTGNPSNNETFVLTDAAGLAVTFVFKTGVATADGTKDGDNVIIGTSGAAGHAPSVGERIIAAINASALAMTAAEVSGGVVRLTQNGTGTAGNTTIDMSGVTTVTATDFTGGVSFTNISLSINQEFSSSYFRGRKHRVRPNRSTGKKNFIVNRFSSPGGPETAGDAHGGSELDVATTQYSIYNTLNYRNLPVRFGLDALQSERRLKFGVAPRTDIINDVQFSSLEASTLVTWASNSNNETIILEDANGNTFTFTTTNNINVWYAAMFRKDYSKIYTAGLVGFMTAGMINVVSQYTGKLNMSAYTDSSNPNRLYIFMGTGTGEAGNGKTITGTAIDNSRLSAPAFSGGTDEDDAYAQAQVTASYHNVNRNTRYYPSDTSPAISKRQSDNFFVQRQIPQSDLNYAWIRNRTIETTASYFGYQNSHFTYPVGDGTTEIGYFESPQFVSASEIGFAKHNNPGTYGDHYFLVDASSSLLPRSGTATFTFSGKPNDGSTITLFDGSTTKIFEIDDDLSGVTTVGNIQVDPSQTSADATGTATQLVTKINAQSGFGITATNPSAGKVNLTTSDIETSTITVNNSTHWNSVTSVNVPSVFTGTSTYSQFIHTDFVGLNTVVLDNVDFKNNQLGYSPEPGYAPRLRMTIDGLPLDTNTFTLTDHAGVFKKYIFDTNETTADGSNFKARGAVQFNFNSGEDGGLSEITLVTTGGVSKTFFMSADAAHSTGQIVDGKIAVSINGLDLKVEADFKSMVTQYKDAINHANGHGGASGILAMDVVHTNDAAGNYANTTIPLRQKVGGPAGNTEVGPTTAPDTLEMGGKFTNLPGLALGVATDFADGGGIVVGVDAIADQPGAQFFVLERVVTAINGSGFGILAVTDPNRLANPNQGDYFIELKQTRRASSGVTKVDNIITATNSQSNNILRFTGINQDGSDGSINQFGVATNGVEDDFLSGISYNAKDLTSTGSQKQININYLNEELANHGPKKSDSFLDTDAANATIEGTPFVLNTILSNRGDCWGWVPWRQMRVQDHKLVRLQRKRNIYTTPAPTNEAIESLVRSYQPDIADGTHTIEILSPFYERILFEQSSPLHIAESSKDRIIDRVRGTVGYSWPDNAVIANRSSDAALEVKDEVVSFTTNIQNAPDGAYKNTLTYEHNSYITQSVVTSTHHPLVIKRIMGVYDGQYNTIDELDDFLNTGNFMLNIYTPGSQGGTVDNPAFTSNNRTHTFYNKYEYFTKEKGYLLYFNNPKNLSVLRLARTFDDYIALGGGMDARSLNYRKVLSDFRYPDRDEDHSLAYKTTLYPKDFYAYNRQVILRPNFIFNDWRQTRKEREAPSDYQNSQFITDENINFSVWPLDAQTNFGKQREMALGKDKVGSISEGELTSTIGLYRSGSNSPYSVSGSAMYSRRSPETIIEHSLEFVNPSKLDATIASDTAQPLMVINDPELEKRYYVVLNKISENFADTGFSNRTSINLSGVEIPLISINLRLDDDVTGLSDYVASAGNQYAVNLNRVFNGSIGGKILRISSAPRSGTITITDIDRTLATPENPSPENQATFIFDGETDVHDGSRDDNLRIIVGTLGIDNATLTDGTVTFSTFDDANQFVRRFRRAMRGGRAAGYHKAKSSAVRPTDGNFQSGFLHKREIKLYNMGSVSISGAPELELINSKWRSHIDPNNNNKVIIKYFGTYETNNFGVPPLENDAGSRAFIGSLDPSLIAILDPVGSGDNGLLYKSSTKTYIGGAAEWDLGKSYGVDPFNYKDYSEFIDNIKLRAKDYSVVPEFRISENIDIYKDIENNDREQFIDPYLDNSLDTPKNTYSITGALEDFKDSSKPDFARAFNGTDPDFKKFFIRNHAEGFGASDTHAYATIKVKAYKKFLPYDGFYPVQRTLQLSKLYNEDYQPLMNQNELGSWQTALKPMFAPGIMYNTIKSGLAVDYPLFVPSSDREFNRFCTRFKGADDNRVEIGSAGTWAKYLTGSLAPRVNIKNSFGTGSTGQQRLTGSAGYTNNTAMQDTESLKGITFSMWIHPYNDATHPYPANYSSTNYWANTSPTLDSGSLIMFGDDYSFHKSSLGRGIEFRKEGDRLVFGVHHTSSYVVFHSKNTGTDILPGLTAFAVGSLQVAPAMTSMFDGGTFTLTNTAGVSRTYIFDDDNVLGANGAANGDNCVVQINDLNNLSGDASQLDTLVTRIAAAINGTAGHNGTITATTDLANDKIDLVQVVGGLEGNTPITFTGGLESFISNVDFNGGGFDQITLNTDGDNYMKPGSWHHVAVSYQWGQNYCDFYVDGFHISSSISASNAMDSNGNLVANNGVNLSAYPISNHLFGGDNSQHAGASLLVDNYKGSSATNQNPVSNCTIGNNKSQYARFVAASSAVLDASDGDGNNRPNYLRYLPMSVDIDEVTIWNKPLTAIDIFGLCGGGISGSRGPWNPELCVRGDDSKDSLIGWFRMGDDFGYVGDTKSGVASPGAGETPEHNTNNLVMYNRARPNNRRFRRPGFTSTETIQQPTTFVTGTFIGFTDNFVDPGNDSTAHLRNVNDNNNPRFYQRGSGVKDVLELMSYDSVRPQDRLALTGALKYPSYITGSWFNETQDTGIPRIGSASWGENRQFPYSTETRMGTVNLSPDHPNANFDGNYQVSPSRDPNGTTARGTVNFWGRGSRHHRGVPRVDRLPFEAIVDPKRFFPINQKVVEGRDAIRIERFVIHETEPHPSASLNSHSWTRHRTGQQFLGNEEELVHSASWNTPTTSSMITSSFDMARLESIKDNVLSDRYSLAANNFFAESMNFFLAGGQTARIISSEFPQDPRIEIGKTYKMRIRLETLNRNTDFPMYNRADAFGPPVDAGDMAFEHNSYENPPTNTTVPTRMATWGYSPFTPPHYDGFAEIEYTFTPQEGAVYPNIEDILDDIGVEDVKFNRATKITGSSPLIPSFGGATNSHFSAVQQVATSSLNKIHAMQITASFKGMSLTEGKRIQLSSVDDGSEEITRFRNAIVIESKFECPTFDFTGVSGSSPLPEGLQKTIGMWHQKPSSISSKTFLKILSPRQFGEDPGLVKDLSQLLGLKMVSAGVPTLDREIKLGQLSNSKQVSEAIVMVPYIDTPNGPRYFLAPEAEVYQAVRERGFTNYQNDYALAYKRLTNPQSNVIALPTPSSIVRNMVDGMMNYVVPPEFNCIKYNGSVFADYRKVQSRLMFFFPFTHTFDQQDLARIWQGVTPKFGENFNKSAGFIFDQNNPVPDLDLENGMVNNFEELQLTIPYSELNDFKLEGGESQTVKRFLIRRRVDNNAVLSAEETEEEVGFSRGRTHGTLDLRGNRTGQKRTTTTIFNLTLPHEPEYAEGMAFKFDEVKFRIFKVKQRAENNYFRKQSLDTVRVFNQAQPEVDNFLSLFNTRQSEFDFEFSVEKDILSYGYNWPYDYFSMIELVKIEAEHEFIADRLLVAGADNAIDVLKSIETNNT